MRSLDWRRSSRRYAALSVHSSRAYHVRNLAYLVMAGWLAGSAALVTGADTPQSQAPAGEHPLQPVLKMARESRDALARVTDYTAVFMKRELIGKKYISQTMDMKVRHEPFSVYLRFQNPHKGREVLFVEGVNGGQLLVHEEGLKAIAGTLSLHPTSKEAMEENRYPITRIGLRNLLESMIAQWEAETKFAETKVQYFPNAKLGNQACIVIETSHPQPRRQFKFHKTRLYLDKESRLPARVEQYGFPDQPGGEPPLLELYTYTELKANVGLTAREFDARNPNYRF